MITLQESQDCFELRKMHLNRYIASNGEYIEGDTKKNCKILASFRYPLE